MACPQDSPIRRAFTRCRSWPHVQTNSNQTAHTSKVPGSPWECSGMQFAGVGQPGCVVSTRLGEQAACVPWKACSSSSKCCDPVREGPARWPGLLSRGGALLGPVLGSRASGGEGRGGVWTTVCQPPRRESASPVLRRALRTGRPWARGRRERSRARRPCRPGSGAGLQPTPGRGGSW